MDGKHLLKVAFSSGETKSEDLLLRTTFKSSISLILNKNTAPPMTHFGVEFQNRSTTYYLTTESIELSTNISSNLKKR